MRRRHNQADLEMLSAGKLFYVVLAVVFTVFCDALSSARPQPQSEAGKAQLERGRYLVEQVSICGDCHTPRDDKGQPIEAKALQGARIMFKPSVPMPNWGEFAPPIAGLPGFTDAQAITFFTTGKNVSGKFAAPPMPPYRFNKEDAASVVAFLRSIETKK
ncbi:MAG TPA: hypothetical protein VKB48_03355 [Candidatus Acidoferrum sp.]|nr:hypothetical protein [Candidatus Acidoferrum sp.]